MDPGAQMAHAELPAIEAAQPAAQALQLLEPGVANVPAKQLAHWPVTRLTA